MNKSLADIRQEGEAQLFSDIKELSILLIPDDEQRREQWFERVQESWHEEKDWYLKQLDKDNVTWAVPDYLCANLLMGSEIWDENDASIFTGKNWFQIDWKDSETSMDFIEDLCERYKLDPLKWSVANPRDELDVESQCIEANKQLLTNGYQIWNIDTGGDAYLLVFLEQNKILHFQDLAKRLNFGIEDFSLNNPPLEQTIQPDSQTPDTPPIPWWSRALGLLALLIFCYIVFKYSMGLFSY